MSNCHACGQHVEGWTPCPYGHGDCGSVGHEDCKPDVLMDFYVRHEDLIPFVSDEISKVVNAGHKPPEGHVWRVVITAVKVGM